MISAFLDGLRRAAAAPLVVVGIWAATLATALPLALMLFLGIAGDLGPSATSAAVAEGWDEMWWIEFRGDANAVEGTFGPWVIGFAAALFNLSNFLDGVPPRAATLPAIVWFLAWIFLAGGVIDRLARQRPIGSAAFFSACGGFVGRFVRLGLIAAVAYGVLFLWFRPWLFGDLYESLARDATVERTWAVTRFGLYVIFGAVLAAADLVFDYTRVRAVVEDRRSMIGALLATLRFMRRHPAGVAGLWLLNGLLLALVYAAYALVAPGAGASGGAVWGAFAVGQLYIAARVFARLAAYASQISYFQSRLAHATYVASPEPRWPDSPSAEALGPPAT
ncbi:MAG: hypothetical protein F4Z04_10485 [Acidobacteria bacterium]|nr:hypothetical protein [Acidobacteriota bacterium]